MTIQTTVASLSDVPVNHHTIYRAQFSELERLRSYLAHDQALESLSSLGVHLRSSGDRHFPDGGYSALLHISMYDHARELRAPEAIGWHDKVDNGLFFLGNIIEETLNTGWQKKGKPDAFLAIYDLPLAGLDRRVDVFLNAIQAQRMEVDSAWVYHRAPGPLRLPLEAGPSAGPGYFTPQAVFPGPSLPPPGHVPKL